MAQLVQFSEDQWEASERRGSYAHGVSRGSEVLKEIRQRGFCGGTRPSDLKITFNNCARNPGGSENNRGWKTVGPEPMMIAANKRLGPDELPEPSWDEGPSRNPLYPGMFARIRDSQHRRRTLATSAPAPFTNAPSSVNALLEDATLMTSSCRNR
jgi:hypothetical protein